MPSIFLQATKASVHDIKYDLMSISYQTSICKVIKMAVFSTVENTAILKENTGKRKTEPFVISDGLRWRAYGPFTSSNAFNHPSVAINLPMDYAAKKVFKTWLEL